MPVYFSTIHTFGTWSEGDPRGYVQRGDGLKESNDGLANWRKNHRSQGAVELDILAQRELHQVVVEVATEHGFLLYTASTTPNHVHQLIAFRSPACKCGAERNYCDADCSARIRVEKYLTRFKRVCGLRLARLSKLDGRKWFSRGWDITRVADFRHFDYLIHEYLPKHVDEGGIVRVYDQPR